MRSKKFRITIASKICQQNKKQKKIEKWNLHISSNKQILILSLKLIVFIPNGFLKVLSKMEFVHLVEIINTNLLFKFPSASNNDWLFGTCRCTQVENPGVGSMRFFTKLLWVRFLWLFKFFWESTPFWSLIAF
jgi:hypothetical protein